MLLPTCILARNVSSKESISGVLDSSHSLKKFFLWLFLLWSLIKRLLVSTLQLFYRMHPFFDSVLLLLNWIMKGKPPVINDVFPFTCKTRKSSCENARGIPPPHRKYILWCYDRGYPPPSVLTWDLTGMEGYPPPDLEWDTASFWPGMGVPICQEGWSTSPPRGVDRHTDACQNITFPRTSYADGKNSTHPTKQILALKSTEECIFSFWVD